MPEKLTREELEQRVKELEQSDSNRRQTEKNLSLFKKVVESATDAIGISTPEGRHWYQNAAFDALFGDIGQDPPATLYRDKSVGRKVFETIMAGDEWSGEVQMHTTDGRILDILLRAYAFTDETGQVLGLVGIHTDITDITERKQAEAELLLEKNFSETLISQLPGSFYMFAENGRMLRWNDNLEKVTGYTATEIRQMNALEFFDEDEKEKVLRRIQEVFVTGTSQVEANFLTRTGHKIPHVLTGAKVEYGGVIYLLGVALDITERKQVEIAYKESETRFRQIAENIREVFWLFDWQQQRVLYVSPAYDLIWGKPRESLYECYDNWGESIHPDDVSHAQETFNRILETGGGEPREYRIIRPDGSERWISDTGYAIKDQDGKVVRITGIAEDITERKHAEEALRNNIHFLESLEIINQAINSSNSLDQMLNNVIETAFKLFDCDRAWLLYPCDPDAPSFKVPIESARPEYPGGKELNLDIPMTPPMQDDMVDALTANGPVTYGPGNAKPISAGTHTEFGVQAQMFMSIRPKAGNAWMFGIHQCSYPRVWTDNERILFNEIGRRIADGLSSLLFFRELTKSEKQYRLLADNITDTIWVLDLHTLCFTYISPSVARITGYRADELTGTHLHTVLTPASVAVTASILSKELSAKNGNVDQSKYRTLELEQYHKDGTTVWTEASGRFIYDNEGQPTSILGVSRDIGKRKRLQNQLHKAQKMESLGLMASGIAHDLNNILSGIVSYPDLLLMDLPEGSPLLKPLETIKESGYRAADVVSDLLTVVRGVAVSKETLNLNTIIAEYLDSPEQKKLERVHPSVTLKTDFDPELLNTNCSSIHVKKSLMNLVINAYESIKGNGMVTISLLNRYLDKPLKEYEGLQAGEYVLLTVTDDGSGICQEDLERIFEPFYTKKVMGRSGTGLGLAVVWNMIQEHDGHINVRSDDQGTVFELYFPASRENRRETEAEIPLRDYVGHGEKILVIDDEDRQREIACALLTKLNYSAHAVPGGEQAVAYLKENSVDLIMLDMIMPMGMSGRETYEQVLRVRPNQKAIIASGFSETEDVKAVQKLGAGLYIKKPYTTEKIGLAVKKELGTKQCPSTNGRFWFRARLERF